MIEKFSTFKIEIFDAAKRDQMISLGIDVDSANTPTEICDVYIDKNRIESFRKSYLYDNEMIDCTSVTMYSGDSYCLIISIDEFIKKLNENN